MSKAHKQHIEEQGHSLRVMLTHGWRAWAVLVLIFAAGALTALGIHSLTEHLQQGGRPLRLSMVGENHYTFIDPLISSNTDGSEVPERYRSLNSELKATIAALIKEKKISAASVYVRDFTTGTGLEVYSGERYNPASLLKVPIMMAFYKIAEGRPSVLDERIMVGKATEVLIQDAYVPQKHVQPWQSYSIEELIGYMIQYSDNTAAATLVDYLNRSGRDYEWLNAVFNDLGIHELRLGSDFIDPKTYSLFLRVLYNATYLNRDMSEKALTMLSKTAFSDGVRAGVASTTLVAHKFGEFTAQSEVGAPLERQLHDCGIVYAKDHPFAICVMTKGAQFSDLAAAIARITRITYDDQAH